MPRMREWCAEMCIRDRCTAYIWRFRYRALLTLRYSSQYYFAEEVKERAYMWDMDEKDDVKRVDD